MELISRKVSILLSEPVIFAASLGWFGCMDHLINLCVNDTVRKRDEVKTIISTVRHIVSFVRDSHLAKETLNKYQRSFGKSG